MFTQTVLVDPRLEEYHRILAEMRRAIVAQVQRGQRVNETSATKKQKQ